LAALATAPALIDAFTPWVRVVGAVLQHALTLALV
jgi:hypothetical protein